MRMNKIFLVFGTSPEPIKMVPGYNTLKLFGEFDVRVCVTGQHRQMLDQVLELFEIKPEFDFNRMKPSQGLSDIATNVLLVLREVFKKLSPDMVLVHG